MIKSSRLLFVIDNEHNHYAIRCPDEETILALMDLIKLSNEALEDCEDEEDA